MTSFWKGKKLPEATKKKMSLSRTGKKASSSTKIKLSLSKSGSKNPSWKGGRIKDGRGYILVKSYTHPFRNTNNYVKEHRLVMEAHIGRYLLSTEIVHHINGIKDDNRIENLALFYETAKHTKLHRGEKT